MKTDDITGKSDNGLRYWFCAGVIVLILGCNLSRDITRPFYGLHSWAQAHGAWLARVHLKYGLGYTKGLRTWAVGDPPVEKPLHYLDHPQLGALISAGVMALLGPHEWSMRVILIMTSAAALLLLLKILRHLVDEYTALLTGLIFALFPINGYFGAGGWVMIFGFVAFWYYLVIIGALKDAPQAKPIHKWLLAAALFLMLQLSWAGFFYAFVIGSHYVFRCIFRRQFPEKGLLAILIIAPLSSLLVDFLIMAAGYNWDLTKILELYKWRSAKGEMREFLWSAWFSKLWEFAVTNYTRPVLFTAILYFTFGQFIVFSAPNTGSKEKTRSVLIPSRRFPQLWLFLMPGVFLLLTFKGLVWRHQYWQQSLSPAIAIAAALGFMLLKDIISKVNKKAAVAAVAGLVVLFFGCSVVGTNYYYSIRWQPMARIKMLKMLNEKIPPDKSLLVRELHTYYVKQHKSKGGHYRPEVAWYLDRRIRQATTFEQVQAAAAAGNYSYYLIAYQQNYIPLINRLSKDYQHIAIRGEQSEQTSDGKFLTAGMMDHILFDLTKKVQAQ